MAKAAVKLNDPSTRKLWHAINRIPDEVLEAYLADNIIDEREIEDITNRLASICREQGLGLGHSVKDHKLIRSLVHHAVHHIRHNRKQGQVIESQLNKVSLREIKQAMGDLLNSGQIKLGTQHLSRDTHEFDYGNIPEPPEEEEGEKE